MKNNTIIFVIIGVLVVTVGALALMKPKEAEQVAETQPESTLTPTPNQSTNTDTMPEAPADAKTAEQVVLKTNMGDIRLDLFKDKAPLTVQNFVTLGSRKYYDGIIFHRVIKGFMIQGGDPTGTGTAGESIYGSTFKDEFNDEKIVKGSLAMANSGPATNGSQFFIVTDSAQSHLDGKHTNFGKVADAASQAVVDKIAAVKTAGGDKPVEEVKITGFEIVK